MGLRGAQMKCCTCLFLCYCCEPSPLCLTAMLPSTSAGCSRLSVLTVHTTISLLIAISFNCIWIADAATDRVEDAGRDLNAAHTSGVAGSKAVRDMQLISLTQLSEEAEQFKFSMLKLDDDVNVRQNELARLYTAIATLQSQISLKTTELRDLQLSAQKRHELSERRARLLDELRIAKQDVEDLQSRVTQMDKSMMTDEDSLARLRAMRRASSESGGPGRTPLEHALQLERQQLEARVRQLQAWTAGNRSEALSLAELSRSLLYSGNGAKAAGVYLRSSFKTDRLLKNTAPVSKDLDCLGDASAGYFFDNGTAGNASTFASWGHFKLENLAGSVVTPLPFYQGRAADGQLFRSTFSHNYADWQVAYGWVGQGLFRFEVQQVTGPSQDFVLSFGGQYARQNEGFDFGWSEAFARSVLLQGGYTLRTHWSRPLRYEQRGNVVAYSVVPMIAAASLANVSTPCLEESQASSSSLQWTETVRTCGLRVGATAYVAIGRFELLDLQEWIVQDVYETDSLDASAVSKIIEAGPVPCGHAPSVCPGLTTCDSCVVNSQCGWCHSSGVCMDGDAEGPQIGTRCRFGWATAAQATVSGAELEICHGKQFIKVDKPKPLSWNERQARYQALRSTASQQSALQHEKAISSVSVRDQNPPSFRNMNDVGVVQSHGAVIIARTTSTGTPQVLLEASESSAATNSAKSDDVYDDRVYQSPS